MQIGAAIYPGLMSIALLLLALPALGQSSPAGAAADPVADIELPPPPVIAPVLYAYATLTSTSTVESTCWQVLIPEREYLIRENNAKPWLLRNAVPLIGAAMGGFTGGFLLKRHATAAVYKRWAVPVILGSAGGGYLLGPGGVTGAVIGGGIGDKLGKQKIAITVASMAGGALAGKALWDMVFPPAVPPAPSDDPEGDIPVEVFLRDKTCGTRLQTAHSQSVYRVGYRFNDEERVAELPYDPGEALLVSAGGDITGPARKRLD
jgi:hypothetical protein